MWLTDEEQAEVRELLRQSTMKNRKVYVEKERAFYHKIKEKYGPQIASAVLAKMWKVKVKEDDDPIR